MKAEISKILLVDDEPSILFSISRLLKGYDVSTATSGEEALLLANRLNFDLVISDYKMPSMNGLIFLSKFMLIQPDAIRIILTGFPDLEMSIHAINDVGVFRFINKPWTNIDIINTVERGLAMKKVLLENRALANEVRQQQALISQQEIILKNLEAEEPGITKVNWGPDGTIILCEDDYPPSD